MISLILLAFLICGLFCGSAFLAAFAERRKLGRYRQHRLKLIQLKPDDSSRRRKL